MSAHRQHYFEANAPMRRLARRSMSPAAAIAVWIVAIFVLVLAAHQLVKWLVAEAGPFVAHGTPVHSPVVVGTPLPPVDPESIEDAKVAAWRAGHQAAIASGCALATLTRPVAQR